MSSQPVNPKPHTQKTIKHTIKIKFLVFFSSSDAAKEDGCNRIAYVGNTHNYEDGAELTEALCEKLGYSGKVLVLVGTKGAPCHEDRALGTQDAKVRLQS